MVDHMELLFQVLLSVFVFLQFSQFFNLLHSIYNVCCLEASLYSTKNETETLNFIFMGSPCAVCQVTMYISHQKSSYGAVLIFFYFKSEVINISFPSFLFTIKVIKCKSQYR